MSVSIEDIRARVAQDRAIAAQQDQQQPRNVSIEDIRARVAQDRAKIPEGGLAETIFEPIKALSGAGAGSAIGGLGGVVSAPFIGSEGASNVIGDIQQDFAAPPQTQAGQDSLAFIQEMVQKGVDITRMPQAVLSGLIDMSINGDPTGALKTAIDVQQDGVLPLAEEKVFEATGSPLLATATGTVPAIASMLFPNLISANLLKRGGFPVKSDQPRSNSTLNRSQATDRENVRLNNEAAKFNQDEKFSSDVEIDQQRALDITNKSGDKNLAKFMLDKDGNLMDDRLAIEAAKQGIDEATIQSIKNMSRADKINGRRMMTLFKKGLINADDRLDGRPSNVIGDVLRKKIVALKKLNTQSGADLSKAAEGLKGKEIDLSEPTANFARKLEEFGIKYTDDAGNIIRNKKGQVTPNFDESSLAPGDFSAFREVIRHMDLLSRKGNPDAFAAHDMKQRIRRNVKFGKKKDGGLSTDAENTFKDFSREIDEALDGRFSNYDNANTQFSETIEAINSMKDEAGKKINIMDVDSNRGLALLTRRIAGNAASGPSIAKSVKLINKTLLKYGVNVDDNINSQLIFTEMLSSRFGPETHTSLQADVGKAVKQAFRGEGSGVISEFGDAVVDKVIGVSDENAIKAIDALLRRP